MSPEDRLIKALQAQNERRAILAGEEPTLAMLEAGRLALKQAHDENYLSIATVRRVWLAMNRRAP